MSHPIRRLPLVIAALLLLALPGCGKESASPQASPAGTAAVTPAGGTASPAPADPMAETVELSVARFDIPADAGSSDLYTQQGGKYYDARWAELAQKFNVRIAYRALEFATRDETLRQMIASGSAPNAMLATLPVAEYKDYLTRGLIRALPAGFEQSYPNIKANLDMVRRRDAYKGADGAYFALPRALEGAEPYTDTTLGLYYRKDLLARSGIAPKDAWTPDELYAILKQVRNDNPGLTLYGHVQPHAMLELGVAQAVPQTARGYGFYRDGSTGKYAYAYRDPAVAGGIKTFKKFYDTGLLDRDFNTRPLYEARVRFADGGLFAFSDTLDIPTINAIYDEFKAVHPDARPEETVGFAWLLDGSGSYVAAEGGNSWSEWVFGAATDDRALTRFLMACDYLMGPEGLAAAVPGGAPTPLIAGVNVDSRICALNTAYSDAAKQAAGAAWAARKSAANLTVLKFDAAPDAFAGEAYAGAAELRPAAAIAGIVRGTRAGGVASAWQGWLNDNAGAIDGILNELNENLAK